MDRENINIQMVICKIIYYLAMKVSIKMVKKKVKGNLSFKMVNCTLKIIYSYEGEYKNDMKEGKGTFHYLNGDQ